MLGIYFFKEGQSLRNELQYLIDHNIMNSGEYQLPDALRRMVRKGAQFTPGKVSDWMDCGNKDAMVDTNRKVLKYIKNSLATPASATIEHSQISPLSKIGEGCVIRNSEIGSGVTLDDRVHVEDCTLQDCIVLEGSKIQRSVISNSMIGRYAQVSDYKGELSLGDFSTLTKGL
jgi:glucose-1-phosphate thymidylyltransferase